MVENSLWVAGWPPARLGGIEREKGTRTDLPAQPDVHPGERVDRDSGRARLGRRLGAGLDVPDRLVATGKYQLGQEIGQG
jgi:hypothetical protein